MGEPDAMELALIVGQSRSERIKGISEEARQKVGPLSQNHFIPRTALKLFLPFKVQLGEDHWGYHRTLRRVLHPRSIGF